MFNNCWVKKHELTFHSSDWIIYIEIFLQLFKNQSKFVKNDAGHLNKNTYFTRPVLEFGNVCNV